MPHQHEHKDISPLDRYGRDLTSLAQQGAFAPRAGHDDRIARIFAIRVSTWTLLALNLPES